MLTKGREEGGGGFNAPQSIFFCWERVWHNSSLSLFASSGTLNFTRSLIKFLKLAFYGWIWYYEFKKKPLVGGGGKLLREVAFFVIVF